MNFGAFLISTFILILIGIIGSYIYIKLDNKEFFGGIPMGMTVGVIGGVLGGFIFDLLFKIPLLKNLQEISGIKYLLVNRFDINFIASFLGVWLFLWIYKYVSEHTEKS
ncbi:MAG: hypothetical protein KFW21_03310 [Spirochaetota bacterium]|nr:hypothetical protein [Spirochaetota bacterium]